MFRFAFRLTAAALAAGLLIGGCSPVQKTPTGRSQLTLYSDDTIQTAAKDAYADVKNKEKLTTSGPKYRAVQEVGSHIAAASGRNDFDWEFILIDNDKMINAWCMPGGKVAVYTGILPIAGDRGGLAAILGHEVAHAMSRHANERASQSTLAGVVGSVLDKSLEGKKKKDTWMAVFGAGATVGVLLPYSRKHESEADEIGIDLMAKAGYNPKAAPELWDRMAEKAGGRSPEFLSTHPDPRGRAATLRSLLPAANSTYNAAPVKRAAAEL